MDNLQWIILTGEYPPQFGGVSDYTQLVARGLAGAGDEVHVWAPSIGENHEFTRDDFEPELLIHRLPDHFGIRGLAKLSRFVDQSRNDARILVQYVPHSFGMKAMNLLFCLWVYRQRRRRSITIMFHEVAFPWVGKTKFVRHNFLAAINRMMCFFLVRSAQRICVSIPGWEKTLRPFRPRPPVEWMPVPSNIGNVVDPAYVRTLRQHFLREGKGHLVGHFGTFGGSVATSLRLVVQEFLALDESGLILLIGRGSAECAQGLQHSSPETAGRVFATGPLRSDEVSNYLSACDLLIQPYVDGVSSRRGTAMAVLACGLPLLTTSGFLTERVWEESGAVCLVKSLPDMAPRAAAMLSDKAGLAKLGSTAIALYRQRFQLERTISALRVPNNAPTL